MNKAKIGKGNRQLAKGNLENCDISYKNFGNRVYENGFELLPISIEHTIIVSTLEYLHRDPFDRILIAQCIGDKLTIATKMTIFGDIKSKLFGANNYLNSVMPFYCWPNK